MNNFNLLISCPRYNEVNATAEIWFTLFISGDKYPVISNLDFSGLISAATSVNNREIIAKIKDILRNDPKFFKFILKIIPIDYVCETNLTLIKELITKHYSEYIDQKDSIRIDLKRRKSKIIERESFIKVIADIFTNKVNLSTPDKIIHCEILGNMTGISFLTPNYVISINPPS